ncbi:(2,3-dihydroxybenzoyl)adenylate synthase [Actinokineospora soli]
MSSELGPDLTPWPAEQAAAYRAAGYWRGRTLDALLREWAAEHADRTALVGGGRRWTYAELVCEVDAVAARLHGLGIGRGDRVVVQLPNVPEFVSLCFALFRLGAQPVLALPAHRSNEINHLCSASDAVAYAIADRHAGFDYRSLAREAVAAAPTLKHVLIVGDAAEFTPLSGPGSVPPDPDPDPSGIALFLLSGGTTGLPKLIPRTHDDYAYNIETAAAVSGLDADTVYLAALPAAHNFPFGCPGILGTLSVGGTVVLAPSPAPPDAFPLIERERVTVTSLVPPLALLWMEFAAFAGRDLSSLALLQVGGAKFKPEAAARVREKLGCALQQVFGMAEGLLCYTRLDDPEDVVVGTQGRPMSPGDEIRVVDADGRDVAPGELGELLTRGPYTLRGYFRAEAYNARAFTPDGFYRSGDLVRVTGTGHLVVEGRIKDVINRGGEKVSAEEVENHLLAHEGVQDAAIVGMPDDVLGERVCAYVVPRGDAPTLPELVAFLRGRGVADYKLPERLEVVAAFPGTGVGKVSKKDLAADIAAKLAAR